MRPGGKSAHDGAITSVNLVFKDPNDRSKGGAFITTGADGKICWWDFKTIDEAEVTEGSNAHTYRRITPAPPRPSLANHHHQHLNTNYHRCH